MFTYFIDAKPNTLVHLSYESNVILTESFALLLSRFSPTREPSVGGWDDNDSGEGTNDGDEGTADAGDSADRIPVHQVSISLLLSCILKTVTAASKSRG